MPSLSRFQTPDNYFSFKKRNFLSKVATFIDLFGLPVPFIIRAKVWAAGLHWDDPLGETLACASQNWFEELPELPQTTSHDACNH